MNIFRSDNDRGVQFKVAINQIGLKPSDVARVLGAVAFFLVLASIGGQLSKYLLGYDSIYGLVNLFDVSEEQNIPTFFSVLLLSCAALLLTVITALKKKQNDPDVSRWTILAFGFLLMAVDEGWSFHERLVAPVRGLLGDGPYGILYLAWVIPGIAVVVILALFFLTFLMRLPAKTRFTFMFAGALYVGGALGVELAEGYYAELHGSTNLIFNLMSSVEESLEMAGVIVFIYALLKYIADNYEEVRFRIDDKERNWIKVTKKILVYLCLFAVCVAIAFAVYSNDKTSITAALPPEAFKAEITVVKAPTEVKVNSSFSVKLKVENTSSAVWPALGKEDGTFKIHLGNHWTDESGKNFKNDDGRTDLKYDLKPGKSVELKLLMTAPVEKGSYIIQYDMVQEMVTWFADKGSKKAETRIRVIE
jgi:hypothetical protein